MNLYLWLKYLNSNKHYIVGEGRVSNLSEYIDFVMSTLLVVFWNKWTLMILFMLYILTTSRPKEPSSSNFQSNCKDIPSSSNKRNEQLNWEDNKPFGFMAF